MVLKIMFKTLQRVKQVVNFVLKCEILYYIFMYYFLISTLKSLKMFKKTEYVLHNVKQKNTRHKPGRWSL